MAPIKGYYLSEEDAEVLRDLIRRHSHKLKQGELNPADGLSEFSEEDHNDVFLPEVYIVEVPEAGIPGMDYAGGTAAATPGHATCNICQMAYNSDSEEWEMSELTYTQEVYNISKAQILRSDQSPFGLAVRDKYGKWIAALSGSGELVLGKLDGAMSYEGSATVSIWDGTSDTGDNVTAYDWLLSSGQSIASGKKVTLLKHSNGKYYVIGAQCA